MAVDPSNMTNDKPLVGANLEWWLLFSVAVANKSADQTAKKLNDFLYKDVSPFEFLKLLETKGQLEEHVRYVKFGQYRRILQAWRELIKLDLADLSVEKLEAIPGIGPKTARMAMMYARPDLDLQIVPLDTHVLKYLRANGIDAPKSTPPKGRRYAALEQEFIRLAKQQGKTVRQLDTEVWQSYQRKTVV